MMKDHHIKIPTQLMIITNVKSISYIEKRISKQFISRYSNPKDFYRKRIINQIISNETAHIVALFKDCLIKDDITEFLQSYYKLPDSLAKLPRIYDYYESCSMIFPNYVILHEKKYICKNIQRKQRIIDFQQVIQEEDEIRRNNIDALESSSIDTVFNTKTLDSLINVTGNSIIMRAVSGGNYNCNSSIRNYNKNIREKCNRNGEEDNSEELIGNIVDAISECEVKNEKKKEFFAQQSKFFEKKKKKEVNIGQRHKALKVFYNNYLTTETNNAQYTQANEYNNNFDKNTKSNNNDGDVKGMSIQMQTISNMSTTKLRMSSIGFTQLNNPTKKPGNHKSTLSMPRLSPRIIMDIVKHVQTFKPIKVKDINYFKADNNNEQPQQNAVEKTDNEYVPMTSRGNYCNTLKINLKSDLSQRMYKKKTPNAYSSRKTFNSISTATASLSLKTQHTQQQPQLQLATEHTHVNKRENSKVNEHNYIHTEQIYSNKSKIPFHKIKSRPISQKPKQKEQFIYASRHIKHLSKNEKSIPSYKQKGGISDNLYDKYYYRSNQSELRNKRNGGLNKISPGFILSYDFFSAPLSDTIKTNRHITFSNELDKRRDQIIKSYRIKSLDEVFKKNKIMNCYSDRERESRLNGVIASVKYGKIKTNKH